MIPIEQVIEWMADHGYRDQYPRRETVDSDVLFYVFVKDGRRKFGVPSRRGRVKRVHFEDIKRLVAQDEQSDHTKE